MFAAERVHGGSRARGMRVANVQDDPKAAIAWAALERLLRDRQLDRYRAWLEGRSRLFARVARGCVSQPQRCVANARGAAHGRRPGRRASRQRLSGSA